MALVSNAVHVPSHTHIVDITKKRSIKLENLYHLREESCLSPGQPGHLHVYNM